MLNQLVEYAKKEGLDPEPGFTTHELHWEAEIDADGKLINVVSLGDKDSGEDTPKCPLMHNMNAGGRAHFLVETVQTVALLFKKKEEDKKIHDSKVRHEFFSTLIQCAAYDVPVLKPLAKFISNPDQISALHNKLKDQAKPNERLRWKVAGVDVIAHPDVRAWWRAWRERDLAIVVEETKPKKGKKKTLIEDDDALSGQMVCFLSGEIVTPLPAHNKIKKLIGGQPSGDVIVGCDKEAFRSFWLKKSSNAAMGDIYASAYVDALNHLIKNHSRKLVNATVVHWFKEAVRPEDDPLFFLYEPVEQTKAVAQSSARQILESLRSGQRPVPTNNRYFALTVSGASGRVMVRDWIEGSFEELVMNICAWFNDLEITNISGKRSAQEPKLESVITCLLRPRKREQKYADWVKPVGHERIDLLHSAIQRRGIPYHVVARLATQFPAFFISEELNSVLFGKQSESENKGLYLSLLYARMGLIKSYFIRKGGNHNMSTYLNKEHPEPAYQCGRLLAVLASLQRSALGDVGAGVVQRYYVAASQTPGLTIGRLIANAKNHLNKLKAKDADEYEDQIAEIMSRIQDRIPATLDLEGQSMFALGYYQQIAGKNN